jgi:CBS domain-containing protein
MIQAKAIMRTDVITVPREEDIREAVRIMALNNITGLPVLNEDGTLAGIVTEKDVLPLFYHERDDPGKVEDFMTAEVICFDQEDALADVVGCLIARGFHRVPILRQGKLAGIISRRDIIKHIGNSRYGEDALERASATEVVY